MALATPEPGNTDNSTAPNRATVHFTVDNNQESSGGGDGPGKRSRTLQLDVENVEYSEARG